MITTAPLIERFAVITAILILVGGSLLVLAPFAAPLLWGAILAYSAWAPYSWLARRLGGREHLAASLIVLLTTVLLLGPFVYAGAGLASRADDAAALLQRVLAEGVPPLPAWITGIPAVGSQIGSTWEQMTQTGSEVLAQLRKLAEPGAKLAVAAGGAVLRGVVELALSIFIAYFLFTGGRTAVAWLRGGLWRIAGERADHLLNLIGGTVRGVVYGILGTALAQGALAWLGLWVAGVPGAAPLGLLTFFLSVVPMGPALVWGPAALWLFHEGATLWAVFLLIWGVGVVSTVDNFIKPLLISQGSAMPFILVMLGVLGGALAFGLLGVFIGPTLLAVFYSVLREWTGVRDQGRSP